MFEHILLKKLLSTGDFFTKVIPVLEPRYFINQGCQSILALIKTYNSQYHKVPNMTELVAMIKNIPNQELRNSIVTDIQQLSKMEDSDTNFMLDETVKFIKNAIFTEALIMGSDAISEKDEDKTAKSKALMEEMSKISLDADTGLDFDDIETMIAYYQQNLIGVLTSHKELNKRLGSGFLPKTLSIIMAASGIGKSLMMTDLVSGQIKENKNVLLVSMEMQDREIMKRVHANALNLDISRLGGPEYDESGKKRENISPDNIRIAKDNLKNTGKFYVKDYPTGSFSPLMLDGLLESYKIEENITFDIVYLDYLGIMKSDLITPSAGLYSYVKSIVEETRAIAVKHNLPIVSASQLNRSATGNNIDTKSISNDSVSDSLGTVQTADFIMFMLQDEKMKEEKLMTCKVTKNRFTGRTDYWDMNIDYTHMRFSDAIVDSSGMNESQIKTELFTINSEDIKIQSKHDNALENFDSSTTIDTSNTPINEPFDVADFLKI